MNQDLQLSMAEPELSGKQWRAEMLEMMGRIADSLKQIYEQNAKLALLNQAKPHRTRQMNHPTYRRMDADRLVITARDGKVDCVYFILTIDAADALDIHPGQKGRIYDDLTCNPNADGGRRAVWRQWKDSLRLRSNAAFDVPCDHDWEIWELTTNAAGLLVKGELIETADPTLS